MIVFLTLCYVAVLFLFIKIGIIRLNLWWKLSPIVWVLLLFIVLFIPMQWGAPSGAVNMYQDVVKITPEVSGEVIEVPVEALKPVATGDVLFRIDPRPFEYEIAGLKAKLELAQLNLRRAIDLKSSNFAPDVTVDQYEAEVGLLKSQIDDAQFRLEKTVVRAPSDGYAVGVTLAVGQRVTNTSQAGWISYVSNDSSTLVMGVDQGFARHIQLGMPAEVTFKILPGKIFNATVQKIAPITPAAQLAPSGNVPLAPTANDVPQPLAIILKLNENEFTEYGLHPVDIARTPGGAFGEAAIYTETSQVSHIIRKVMLRMSAWMNYIMPI